VDVAGGFGLIRQIVPDSIRALQRFRGDSKSEVTETVARMIYMAGTAVGYGADESRAAALQRAEACSSVLDRGSIGIWI
jgi:hypothetical protein